jgi:hypothetical protein
MMGDFGILSILEVSSIYVLTVEEASINLNPRPTPGRG